MQNTGYGHWRVLQAWWRQGPFTCRCFAVGRLWSGSWVLALRSSTGATWPTSLLCPDSTTERGAESCRLCMGLGAFWTALRRIYGGSGARSCFGLSGQGCLTELMVAIWRVAL